MEKTVREVDCENLHRNQSAIRTGTDHFILLILQQVGGVKEGGMHCNTIEESEECGRIHSRAHSPLWNESESIWSDNAKVKKKKKKEKWKMKKKNPSSSAYWTSNKTIKTVTLDIKKMVDKRELCHSPETWTSIYIFCDSTIAFCMGYKQTWMVCKLCVQSLCVLTTGSSKIIYCSTITIK